MINLSEHSQTNELTTISEISKVSSVKAISALSRMLQRPVGIEPLSIELCDMDDLHLLPKHNDVIISTFIPVKGTIFGASLLIYPEESALAICDLLLNRVSGATQVFDDIEKSALLEIANICIGNYLTAFSESLQIHLMTHQIAIFDQGSLAYLNSQITHLFLNANKKSSIKLCLNFHLNNAKGMLIFLFDKKEITFSLMKLIDKTCMSR